MQPDFLYYPANGFLYRPLAQILYLWDTFIYLHIQITHLRFLAGRKENVYAKQQKHRV